MKNILSLLIVLLGVTPCFSEDIELKRLKTSIDLTRNLVEWRFELPVTQKGQHLNLNIAVPEKLGLTDVDVTIGERIYIERHYYRNFKRMPSELQIKVDNNEPSSSMYLYIVAQARFALSEEEALNLFNKSNPVFCTVEKN